MAHDETYRRAARRLRYRVFVGDEMVGAEAMRSVAVAVVDLYAADPEHAGRRIWCGDSHQWNTPVVHERTVPAAAHAAVTPLSVRR